MEVIPDLVVRLRELEARLTALERRLGPEPAEDEPAAPALDPELFWALHGLQDRIGSQSAVLFTGSVRLPSGARYEWQQGAEPSRLMEDDASEQAASLSALGHPARLSLLRHVLSGADTSATLGATRGFGTSGQLYHHLRELTAAGWLRSVARGRYEVPAPRVIPLLVILAASRP